MDKKQFIEHMIEQARGLTLSSVVQSRITLSKRVGINQLGYCPFHSDRHLGSFVVTDSKRIWYCFTCGIGGDTIKFISQYDNVDYLAAAFKVALENRIISQSDYDDYYANRRYKKTDIDRIQQRYEQMDKDKWKNNIAKDDVLNKVFRMFIDCCELSAEHKAHLMEERNLSEEKIKEGMYFTFPTRGILRVFMEKIRKAFGSEDILMQIPGFYKEDGRKSGKKSFTFAKHKGIGIGIQNAYGQVVGIQIRHDKKSNGPRYVWFSSSFAIGDEKYEGGVGAGAPVDVVFPKVIRNTSIIITEGRFKAEAIAEDTGSIAISVQGVSSWRGIIKSLEQIPRSGIAQNRFGGKKYRINCLLIAFDADMNYKYQVAEQLRKMSDQLEANSYFVYYLNWDDTIGKGIDDVLHVGQRSAIKRYDKERWDTVYAKMIEFMLKAENVEKVSQIPDEVVKRYFLSHMMPHVTPLRTNELGKKHQVFVLEKEA